MMLRSSFSLDFCFIVCKTECKLSDVEINMKDDGTGVAGATVGRTMFSSLLISSSGSLSSRASCC